MLMLVSALALAARASDGRAPYKFDSDFAGISIAANVPLVITAHPSVPANNLREFATLLQKDRSLKYNYGSTGPGSFMNILGDALKPAQKTHIPHIPPNTPPPPQHELPPPPPPLS